MTTLAIKKSGTVHQYSDSQMFLNTIETLLSFGERFLVIISKAAKEIAKRIGEIFKRHGIKLTIEVDSDPEAADYIVNGFLGVVVGGVAGAGLGFVASKLLDVAAMPFALVGAAAGAVIGLATGILITNWGLKVRFSRDDSADIEIEMVPKS